MRQIQTVSESTHHTAVQIGKLDQISDYAFVHPTTGQTVNGKVFVKDATHATGTEISFTNIPPHTDLSYFHKHDECEETYIFLSGEGFFQVDDDVFPISEGSVVRVAPHGVRGLSNQSNSTMTYVCIESAYNSLQKYWTEDGSRVDKSPRWITSN